MYFFLGGEGWGSGTGRYNSSFITDRGTGQQVKMNGQGGFFTEGGGQFS